MLQGLENYISGALTVNQNLLPRNPHIATQIQAKITILQSPMLASDIINGRFYSASSVTSRNGRTIPIVSVYPLDSMRTEASDAVQSIKLALPILEDFMSTPFPTDVIRIWYGFIMGNSGGGGMIYMEDRGSYEARRTPGMTLYEAILDHELSHSYIGHESLTQFLELYVYNMVHTNSANVQSWIFVRNYVPYMDSNEGYAALLDIYQLIGRDAMANAYRTIYPLRPPYGQPLCSECKQAFVDQAPAALRAQVADKLAKIT